LQQVFLNKKNRKSSAAGPGSTVLTNYG